MAIPKATALQEIKKKREGESSLPMPVLSQNDRGMTKDDKRGSMSQACLEEAGRIYDLLMSENTRKYSHHFGPVKCLDNIPLFEAVLKVTGPDFQYVKGEGACLLHRAVEYGSPGYVELLIKEGALGLIDDNDTDQEMPIVTWAFVYGNYRCVVPLIKAGASTARDIFYKRIRRYSLSASVEANEDLNEIIATLGKRLQFWIPSADYMFREMSCVEEFINEPSFVKPPASLMHNYSVAYKDGVPVYAWIDDEDDDLTNLDLDRKNLDEATRAFKAEATFESQIPGHTRKAFNTFNENIQARVLIRIYNELFGDSDKSREISEGEHDELTMGPVNYQAPLLNIPFFLKALSFTGPHYFDYDYTPDLINRVACSGQLPLLKILIKRGADVNSTRNGEGPPLAQALEHLHLDIAEELLIAGASPQFLYDNVHLRRIIRGHACRLGSIINDRLDALLSSFGVNFKTLCPVEEIAGDEHYKECFTVETPHLYMHLFQSNDTPDKKERDDTKESKERGDTKQAKEGCSVVTRPMIFSLAGKFQRQDAYPKVTSLKPAIAERDITKVAVLIAYGVDGNTAPMYDSFVRKEIDSYDEDSFRPKLRAMIKE